MDTLLNKEEESELLQSASKGDQEAIEKIILKYKALVCKIARGYYISSGGDTYDLIQEGTIALLKAIREFDSVKNDASFFTFASTCVNNKIKDVIRSMKRKKQNILSDAVTTSENDEDDDSSILDELEDKSIKNPLARYIDDEAREEFYTKVASIATQEQLSVLKLYLEGDSYKEIAEKLQMTSKKVDNTLNAVKNKIRKAKNLFTK